MRTVLLPWVLFLVLPLSLVTLGPTAPTPPARAAVKVRALAEPPTAVAGDDLDRKVESAIALAVEYLKSMQVETTGSWEIGQHRREHPGGWTALVLLALLTAGEKVEDKNVKAGLEYLRKVEPKSTYVVSLQTMVFCLANQNEDRERIRRNVSWLLENRMPDGWTYNPRPGPIAGLADNSNTQYALLALHEAVRAGVPVPEKDLLAMRQVFLDSQVKGAWGYKPDLGKGKLAAPSGGARMTMTTAGLSNLIITGLDLTRGKAKLREDGSAENCGVYAENAPVADAIAWIGDRFPADLSPANATGVFNGQVFYGLYGLERAGRLTGERFFGGHDWYEVGCRFLVQTQKADGHWEGSNLDQWPVVATSFALLFLAKGKAPVLISKLAYGGNDYLGWNNKHSDIPHLVEFASKELFHGLPLGWQAFDVRAKQANTAAARRALAAQLLTSPIVYFNGHDRAPRDKEEEVLREYVNNGGFILAENCCGKARHPDFDRDFRALMKRLFPDSELKRLEPEHPVWLASGKFAVSPRDFPLEGIKHGCKTVVIYSPVPLAGYWEANDTQSVKGKKAFACGANIIAYATGLEAPRPRLARHTILTEDPVEKIKRGFLRTVQLKHEGDWQPARRAVPVLMSAVRKEGLDVMLQPRELYPSSKILVDYRFFYMHGRQAFNEKKEDLKTLRFLLENGGTLLADACCGSRAFDRSFHKFIAEMFAEDKLKLVPIPPNDELFSAELNGTAIERVNCRQVGRDGKVTPTFQSVPPALLGVRYKERWIVIYSPADIGCALEGHSSPDCLGHDHDSALKLARAAVLYALKR